MILKYTASRATENQIIALIPANLRTEVTDALRADAWLGVIIRPEKQPIATWHDRTDR